MDTSARRGRRSKPAAKKNTSSAISRSDLRNGSKKQKSKADIDRQFSTISVARLNHILGEDMVKSAKLPSLVHPPPSMVKDSGSPLLTTFRRKPAASRANHLKKTHPQSSKENQPLRSGLEDQDPCPDIPSMDVLQRDLDEDLDQCLAQECHRSASSRKGEPSSLPGDLTFESPRDHSKPDAIALDHYVMKPSTSSVPLQKNTAKCHVADSSNDNVDSINRSAPVSNNIAHSRLEMLPSKNTTALSESFDFQSTICGGHVPAPDEKQKEISRLLGKQAAFRADLDEQIRLKKERKDAEKAKILELEKKEEMEHRAFLASQIRSNNASPTLGRSPSPFVSQPDSIPGLAGSQRQSVDDAAMEAQRLLNRQRATQSRVFGGASNDGYVDPETKRRLEKEALKVQIEQVKMRKEEERQKEAEMQRLDDERVERERRVLEERWAKELRAEGGRVSVNGDPVQERTIISTSPAPVPAQQRQHSRPRAAQPGSESVDYLEQQRRHLVHRQSRASGRHHTPSPVPGPLHSVSSTVSPASSSGRPSYDELTRLCHDLTEEHQRMRNEMSAQSRVSQDLLQESRRSQEVVDQLETLKRQVESLSRQRSMSMSSDIIGERSSSISMRSRDDVLREMGGAEVSSPRAPNRPVTKQRPGWASRSKAGAPLANVHESVDLDSPNVLPTFSTSTRLLDDVQEQGELGSATKFIFPEEHYSFYNASSGMPHNSRIGEKETAINQDHHPSKPKGRRARPKTLNPFLRSRSGV